MEETIRAAFRAGRVADTGALVDDAAPRLLRAGRHYNVVHYQAWYYVIPHALGPLDLSEAAASLPASVRRTRSFVAAERELESLDMRLTADA